MLNMNFDDWVKHRRKLLTSTDGVPNEGRRGKYVAFEPVTIFNVTNMFDYIPSSKLSAIVDAEYQIAYNANIINRDLVLDKLYFGDTYLLGAYLNLHLANLAGHDDSRNNLIMAPYCCLCQWQLYNHSLYVTSRSLDIKSAGLSDPLLINRVAESLGAKDWTLYINVPHKYIKTETVARRKNANTRI